jgi:hypothetical protein
LQDKYLTYYKQFLYAYHTVRGRPYLDGYEWSGPDGSNDKKLTERFYRTYQKLGYIGERTVITGADGTNDDEDEGIDLPDAKIETWAYKQTLVIPENAVGVGVNFVEPGETLIASSDGNVYNLEADRTTIAVWQNVTSGGETLQGIATDPAQPQTIWTLHTTASDARIKSWDYDTGTKITEFVITGGNQINDISVNVSEGELYCVANDGVGNVQVRDINNGVELTGSGGSFASGFTGPVGCSFNGGLVYVIASSGRVRMLFASDGNFAATFESGVAANGIMADASRGEIWIIQTNGDIRVYKAHVAIDVTPAPDVINGYPGFDSIVAGQFVHIVAVGDTAFAGKNNKCVIVYSPGKYETEVVISDIGEPNRFERTWVTGDQRVAFMDFTKVRTTVSEQVIQGEESRVCDWKPREDGTGAYRDRWFKTKRGSIHHGYTNWWPKEWNVPDSDFLMTPPEWTEGISYLQEYLVKNNKERTIQTLRCANINNVWREIVLGGLYTVQMTQQGGPSGLSGTLRVLAYEPDELNGVMTISGEWI